MLLDALKATRGTKKNPNKRTMVEISLSDDPEAVAAAFHVVLR